MVECHHLIYLGVRYEATLKKIKNLFTGRVNL